MRVTLKFAFALILGIVLVHGLSVVVRINRERNLFWLDTSRDARVLGRVLGYAVQRAWKNGGESDAMEIIQHATEQEGHVHIRWVWLDDQAGGSHAPAASLDLLKPLYRGESVAMRLGEGDGILYTYIPVRVPVERTGAIEVSDALTDEQDYLEQSIFNATAWALVLVAICGGLAIFLG
ncbi:MAG: hypothetical protein V1754_15830, partial [Pseudomonadota bacterium]